MVPPPPITHSSRRDRLILWLWKRLPFKGGTKLIIAWFFNIRYAVGVAAVITNEAGEVLLLRHTYRQDHYQWGLPGGWAKGRESMERALMRELEEETGWRITITRLVAVHSGFSLPRMTLIFQAHITGGKFRPSDEVSEYRFVRPDDLDRVLPAEKMAVRQALELL
ncbi:MAG TPA: NUDIX domain-containing protein [Chloroflexota bacterium]|nr:NUDIX domain-containing protein [Chloroflexota bacterium]